MKGRRQGGREGDSEKRQDDRKVKGPRISLSFRKIVGQANKSATPVKMMAKLFENVNSSSTDSATLVQPPTSASYELGSKARGIVLRKKMTTVIFGTSITFGVKGELLGHKGRKCINKSKRGAKVGDISRMLDEFYYTDSAACDIEKVILSFGTNDIKYEREGVGKLYGPIVNVIEKAKAYFPGSIIFVQCCLPIRNVYTYTVPNVLNFNRMLRDICNQTSFCLYVDCFNTFLSEDGNDYNRYIYRDWLHPNRRGEGLLCRWFKFIINNDHCFGSVINHMGF